jgi:carboxyl-terminal processing protease
LRYGDAIVAVGGENAEDWSTEQVMQRVRGEKGEPVEITVERAGIPRHITVQILRDEVKLPSVRNAFMAGNTGTGYIALTGGFSRKTEEELATAIARLKQEGMRQLILDLRNNQGGLLDEAVKVAEKFLPPGLKIVEVRGRDGLLKGHTSEVPDGNIPELVPMVVLINKRSASASEVVSGALQDHDRALIVGETSFGKGLVQTVFPLWGGTGLTLTTAKYYTPKGRSLQRDYSTGSYYDYYANRTDVSRGDLVHTDLGRAVYGGGGITPDVEVKATDSGAIQGRLFSSAFHFARLLVSGQISGFREYRVYEAQPRTRLSPEDIDRYPITDKLITAFREFIRDKPHFAVPDTIFDSSLDYVRERLRSEIITAAYGPEAGQQAYLLHYDIQFLKALEKLPEARQLAENVSRLRGERQ